MVIGRVGKSCAAAGRASAATANTRAAARYHEVGGMKGSGADSAHSVLQPGDRLAIAGRSGVARQRCGKLQRRGGLKTGHTDWRRFSARSVLARRPQIFVETGADIRHEQFLDAHAAAREFLLIEITHERIEGRAAALDRIVPDLRPEYVARRFRLLDYPGKADRQRVGVIDRLIGQIARPAEGAVEAHGDPGLALVKAGLEYERMHDRKDARLPVIVDLDLARIPKQPADGLAETARDHHRGERVDLAVLEYFLQRGVGPHGLQPDAGGRLYGADRLSPPPPNILPPDP